MMKARIRQKSTGIMLASYGRLFTFGHTYFALSKELGRTMYFPVSDFEILDKQKIPRKGQSFFIAAPPPSSPCHQTCSKMVWESYKAKCVENGWEPTWEGLVSFAQQIADGLRVAPDYILFPPEGVMMCQ